MLVRTLLAVSGDRARRIEALLDRRDVLVVGRDSDLALEEQIERGDVDLLVTDGQSMDTPVEAWISRHRVAGDDHVEVLVLRDGEDAHDRAALLAAGALAVLNLRLPDAELRRALRAVARRPRVGAADRIRAAAAARQGALDALVSESPSMTALTTLARRVATSDSSVLILGETGAGKERLARAIHLEGPRRAGPFVPVNCGAIPEGLLESELFGHEAGAFTGATRPRRGHFELAHGGTLFLDEIGELPLALQVKLLRALEDREIQRLGGEELIRLDLRIVAATNRDLEDEVTRGRFRADLFYRLAVVTLTVPPLRERPEDIPVLVEEQLRRFGPAFGKPTVSVTERGMAALTAYAWPGNVRELINVLERAVLLSTSTDVDLPDLPRAVAQAVPGPDRMSAGEPDGSPPWTTELPIREARRRAVDAFERAYLPDLLTRAGGRINEAARLAGINERSLFDLLRRHGIRKEDFR